MNTEIFGIWSSKFGSQKGKITVLHRGTVKNFRLRRANQQKHNKIIDCITIGLKNTARKGGDFFLGGGTF